MKPLIYAGITLTVLAWGSYGPVLHKGQAGLGGHRFKPLICVGLAYLVVAVLIPVAVMAAKGTLKGDWTSTGFTWSFAAGVCGTLGALGIILALTSGGKPPVVMPLVFGCAPIMTVLVTMLLHKLDDQPIGTIRWQFLVGILLLSVGAATVIRFQPKGKPHAPPAAAPATETTDESA